MIIYIPLIYILTFFYNDGIMYGYSWIMLAWQYFGLKWFFIMITRFTFLISVFLNNNGQNCDSYFFCFETFYQRFIIYEIENLRLRWFSYIFIHRMQFCKSGSNKQACLAYEVSEWDTGEFPVCRSGYRKRSRLGLLTRVPPPWLNTQPKDFCLISKM